MKPNQLGKKGSVVEETMWTNQLALQGNSVGNTAVRSSQERKDAVTQLISIISIVVQSAGIAFRRSEAEGERVVQTLCELSQQALTELRAWPVEELPTTMPKMPVYHSGVFQETFSHTISRTLHVTASPEREAPVMVEKLTPREKDMLRLIVKGLSNKEIGAALHLTEGTVKGYISHLLAKLNVRSRTQAALVGMELELV
jgi:DNA-binding CsgD family transcriptional regulator